jgi:ATP-dependent DNA helicase RecG
MNLIERQGSKKTGGYYPVNSQPQSEGLNEELNGGLNEGLKTLLIEIKKNEGIQAKELSIHLNNRPIKTIERQIKELKNMKLIERRGSKKTGGYYLIQESDGETNE